MKTYYASDWTGRMDSSEAMYWYAVGVDMFDRETTPYEHEKIRMANDWMFAGDYRVSWTAKWQAIKAITTNKDAEIEHYFEWLEETEWLPEWFYKLCNKAIRFSIRALCLFILLLNRDTNASNESCSFSWGYQPSYAGWDAWFIDFDLKHFRYYLYTDGDWNM